MFALNFMTISGLLIFVSCLFIAVFVLFNNHKKIQNITWAIYSISVSFWGFGLIVAFAAQEYKVALAWGTYLNYVALFIPILFIHFVVVYLHKHIENRYLIRFGYVFTILLFLLSFQFPRYFIADVVPKLSFKFYPSAGPLFYVFALFFTLVVTKGLFDLWVNYKKRRDKQSKLLLAAVLIGFGGGSTTFPLVFNMPFYPIGTICPAILAAMVAYAITKHNLLDITTVITRTGSYIITFGAFTLTILFPYKYTPFPLLSILMLGFIWIVFGDKLREKIQTTAEKKWVTDWYDPPKVVKQVSENLSMLFVRDEIIDSAYSVINDAIPVKTHLLIIGEADHDGSLYHYKAINSDLAAETGFDLEDGLIALCKNTKVPILSRNLGKDLREKLKIFGFKKNYCLLPLHTPDTLEGVIVLGERLSEAAYSPKDTAFFETLIDVISLILERMLPYEKIKKDYNQTLEAAERMSYQASFSKLSLGIAHEIRNPLAAIRSDAETHTADIESFIVPWNGVVNEEHFTGLLPMDQKSADIILKELQEKEYLNNEFCLTEKFDPYSDELEIDLPDDLKKYECDIYTLLFEINKKKEVTEYFKMTTDMVDRVVNITETMLKYGIADTQIKPDSFVKIEGITLEDSEQIWHELVKNKYLGNEGGLLKRFSPDAPGFTLELSSKFELYEIAIIHLLKEMPVVKKEKLELNKVLDSVFSLLEGTFKKESIQFKADILEKYYVLGNEFRLYQAFFNIVKNSIQALEKVADRPKEISCSIRNASYLNLKSKKVEGLEIVFSDNGPGIPEGNISKIMDPFFTTKETTFGKNLGLGLPVLFQVIIAHGGVVKIDSELNRKTEFKICLPLFLD
ncbi:ATP-binding protein [Candidatus Margulisiibacteriota bacterium]